MTIMIDNLPEFGIKRENEERRDGGIGIVFDPKTQKYAVGKHTDGGFLRLFSGGVDAGEDIKEGTLREVIEESGLNDFLYVEQLGEVLAHYRNILRQVNRVTKATCFLIILKSANSIGAKLEEHEKFDLVWVTAEELIKHWEGRNENKDCDHWVYFLKKADERIKELGYDKMSKP